MASKQTVVIQPYGDLTIKHHKFASDREAYADMQGQNELALMMRGVDSRSSVKETVTVTYDNGQTVVMTYSYDSALYWDS